MVISEMFAASHGLGFTVVQFQRTFSFPEMWTGIIVLDLLGVCLSLAFQVVERRMLRWYHGLRGPTGTSDRFRTVRVHQALRADARSGTR